MESIHFLNETLWTGNLGNILVAVASVSALLSSWYYFQAANTGNLSYANAGRLSFKLQAASVVGIFAVLFYIIFDHQYEYFYAWRHSSNSLPVYYMISCFWEGQEGSFLLWMFWNAVIGLILLKTAKNWEPWVMSIVSLAQFALSTMILGVDLGVFNIGSNPFELLRDVKPEFLSGIPNAEGKANYLKALVDGNGLNALLQNYWMVIHPPTLFFGFATALVPFAYSIAALWKGDERGWLEPALKWSLVCVGVLGLGIIMGGFWAYESLSFGGYWAWDPVENASLMPWLIMASAAHMVLISKGTGRHMFTSHLLVQISFLLVLYATFLTRSGILGEASVHSFTDLGLSGQLLLFLFLFIGISLISSIENLKLRKIAVASVLGYLVLSIVVGIAFKSNAAAQSFFKAVHIGVFFIGLAAFIYFLFKRTKSGMEDEKWTSRELWMFIGAMFLILSLVQVFSATSIPVFNKLFGFNTAVPKEDVYNRVQLWLAMPVMILMAIGQFFRYRDTPMAELKKDLWNTLVFTLVLFVGLAFGFQIQEAKYLLFLAIGIWLVVGNIVFVFKKSGFRLLSYGATIAHAGFGILLIGVLVSSANKKVITKTTEGIDLMPEQDEKGKTDKAGVEFNRENRLLYKGKPAQMGDYSVVFKDVIHGKGADSIDKYFRISFYKINHKGNVTDSFDLLPKSQNNPKMGLLAEPSTRHYIHKDLFTHINYESSLDKEEPFSGFKTDIVKPGQDFLTNSGKVKLRIDSLDKYQTDDLLALKLVVTAASLNEETKLRPAYLVDTSGNTQETLPAQSDELGVYLRIEKPILMDGANGAKEIAFEVSTGERSPKRPYVVIKVIEFPWINLVWSGTIIMVIGFVVALINRMKQSRALANG